METRYFTAQDSTGERRRVRILPTGHDSAASGHPRDGYALDDGSPVRRVDNDTFQVVGSGAYITRVPE
ncbi:hypothetical protein [Pseudoxanthomonas sp.]|uniref:hypothetical protein n=1 Tax=Pseudoxanthomonas sp. TaxID=1871049 RepID=UPI00260652E1|nr:hypothetical protein [Pseudoxanthomonas sp.]WDS35548.1 MAG: hypothetical protein O8I58_14570 [Pseudoxanthomonas sp.]